MSGAIMDRFGPSTLVTMVAPAVQRFSARRRLRGFDVVSPAAAIPTRMRRRVRWFDIVGDVVPTVVAGDSTGTARMVRIRCTATGHKVISPGVVDMDNSFAAVGDCDRMYTTGRLNPG